MRLLVTNDDGIEAAAIHVLVDCLAAAGHDLLVVAPASEMSGAGASMGLLSHHEGLHFRRVDLASGVDAFALDAPPAACVILGLLGAFGDPPDLVVSGINYGPNTGRSVLHSGTVGAALTAANWGSSGLAVSQRLDEEPHHWATAAGLAEELIHWFPTAPQGSVLNLNVPDLPREQVKGVVSAELAAYGSLRTSVVSVTEGFIETELVSNETPVPADTDTALLAEGYATVTLLDRPAAVDPAPFERWLARRQQASA